MSTPENHGANPEESAVELLARQIEGARMRLWRAQEDAILLEARAAESDAPSDLLSAVRAQQESLASLDQALRALENERARPEVATELVQADRASDGRTTREPGSEVRQIGRPDVSVAKALDRFDILGKQRQELLASRQARLDKWLEDKPFAWVTRRRDELGPPEQALSDRSAALHTMLIEAKIEAVETQLQAAEKERRQFDVDGLRDQLQALKAQEQEMRHGGDHLEHHLDEDRLVLSAAYEDAVELRQAIRIAQQVDTAVMDLPESALPSLEDTLRKLGELPEALPEQSVAERAAWNAIVRELQTPRGPSDQPTRGAEPRPHEQPPRPPSGPELGPP